MSTIEKGGDGKVSSNETFDDRTGLHGRLRGGTGHVEKQSRDGRLDDRHGLDPRG